MEWELASVAALIIFILVIASVLLLVLKPTSIPLGRGRRLALPFWICPPLGVALMLCFTSMTWADVGRGIVGDDAIKPYGIMILFMALAYVGAAVDSSGIFAFLALKIAERARGSGRLLFVFFFLLSSFITAVTNNDVSIVTLTPIIIYFAKAAGVDPIPFLLAEYVAGNIFGALLYVGNPTNIIVAQAFDMSFIGFSKIMTLPTFAAGVVGLATLWVTSIQHVPVAIKLPNVQARALLRDVLGAWFHSATALACLGLLAAAPSLGWEMWAICLVCAGICCTYNLVSMVLVPAWQCKQGPLRSGSTGAEAPSTPSSPGYEQGLETALTIEAGQPAKDAPGNGKAGKLGAARSSDGCVTPKDLDSCAGTPQQDDSPGAGMSPAELIVMVADKQYERDMGGTPSPDSMLHYHIQGHAGASGGMDMGQQTSCSISTGGQQDDEALVTILGKNPTFIGLLAGMPWEVVPFALGMFVLVEALSVQGWLTLFANGLGKACSQSLPAAVWIMGWLSVLLSNTINNQPMTILLTRVTMDSAFVDQLVEAGGTRRHQAALFALVMASNLGAIFTIIGALAGIMWSNIMRSKGIEMSFGQFLKLAPPMGTTTMVVSMFILWFEYAVFPTV